MANSANIEELVSRVFAARDAAHKEHWATQSFSKHSALGDFYDAVIESIDKFVEVYQGYFGLIGEVGQKKFPLDAMKWMPDEIFWMCSYETEICKNDLMLQNIFEELTGVYTRTLYKLTNLK